MGNSESQTSNRVHEAPQPFGEPAPRSRRISVEVSRSVVDHTLGVRVVIAGSERSGKTLMLEALQKALPQIEQKPIDYVEISCDQQISQRQFDQIATDPKWRTFVLFLLDMSDPASLEKLPSIVKRVKDSITTSGMREYLVCNKMDLTEEERVLKLTNLVELTSGPLRGVTIIKASGKAGTKLAEIQDFIEKGSVFREPRMMLKE